MISFLILILTAVFLVNPARGQALEPFKYESPGKLVPSVSGTGDPANRRIYASQIGMPMQLSATQHMYPNSQVFRKGGSVAGDQGLEPAAGSDRHAVMPQRQRPSRCRCAAPDLPSEGHGERDCGGGWGHHWSQQ